MSGKRENALQGGFWRGPEASGHALQVCGSDDKTYTSSCAAGCANVKPQYTGACKPVATSERSAPILSSAFADNLKTSAHPT